MPLNDDENSHKVENFPIVIRVVTKLGALPRTLRAIVLSNPYLVKLRKPPFERRWRPQTTEDWACMRHAILGRGCITYRYVSPKLYTLL